MEAERSETFGPAEEEESLSVGVARLPDGTLRPYARVVARTIGPGKRARLIQTLTRKAP